MGKLTTPVGLRSWGVGLLTALSLAATGAASAAPSTTPGGVSMTGIQVTSSGLSANVGGKALQGRTSVNPAVRSPAPSSASPVAMPVVMPAAPAPGSGMRSASLATAEAGPGRPWQVWLALVGVFLGLAGVVGSLMMPAHVSRRRRGVEAIEDYFTGPASSEADERSVVSSISASLVNLGDKVMDSRMSTPKTQRLLERADLPLRLGEWAVLRVVAVVVGVAGGIVLMNGSLISMVVGSCLGVLAGVVGPALFLKLAASRRARKFDSQLPDVLTLVASSLSTGFSLLQSLDAVAKDAAQPAAKEFARALAETRIGADLNDSLEHLADRMESTNLRWTAMAINIQRQVGGNLGETLRNTAATLRDREALGRHVKALAAEGKLSAYILIALPVGVFGFMLVGNRAYVALLWTTMMGIGMLVAALISMGIGILWMNKVVKVEI